jgi:hypothetical protein
MKYAAGSLTAVRTDRQNVAEAKMAPGALASGSYNLVARAELSVEVTHAKRISTW